MTDVLPTLLSAAGGVPDPSWKVDGQNVLGVWRGVEKSPSRTLFWEWRAEGYQQTAAMRGNLKLVVTGNTAPELYDVEADPAEMRPIQAEHPTVVNELGRELAAWLATETDASKDRGERAAPGRRRRSAE